MSEPREVTKEQEGWEEDLRVRCEAGPRAGRHNGHISAWPPV